MMAKAKTQVKHRPRPGELHDEPRWDSPVTNPTDVRLSRALAYYNYVDMKDKEEKMRGWLISYMEETGFSPYEISIVKKMETWRITNTLSTLSRMITNGCQLPTDLVTKHHNRIRAAIATYRLQQEARTPVKQAEGPRWDNAKERERQSVALMEDAYDEYCETGVMFSPYEILVKHEVSKAHALAISSRFKPLLEELREVKGGKVKDLKEAYSHLTRVEISRSVEQVASIVSDADRYALNKKAAVVRKPRKKKEKAAAAVVSRVTYLKEHAPLKLVSTDPALIVGAREVWLYSVKYKSLKRLTAAEGKTLTVSGSTVKGYSDILSECRTLRKPEETLAQLVGGTVHTIRKIMPSLTTKPSEVNGRINQETVIVRVLK